MKKTISILITLILLIIMAVPVKATETVTATITTSKSEVKEAEEIEVTISINNFTRAGENKAIEAKLEYDANKLEYKEINWKTGWTGSISSDKTGIAASKSGAVSGAEEIATITYEVKAEAEKGKTNITIKDIITSADGDEIEATGATKEIEIIEKIGGSEENKIVLKEIEITKAPTKTEYKVGENFDKTGMIVTGIYSDGTKAEITNYRILGGENLQLNQHSVLINYTVGDRELEGIQKITVTAETQNTDKEEPKQDGTTNDKELPKTGVIRIGIPVIIISLVAAVISYKKYKMFNK